MFPPQNLCYLESVQENEGKVAFVLFFGDVCSLHQLLNRMTAYELIHALPSRLKKEQAKAGGHAATVHFIFSGEGACELTVVMADGEVQVTDGLHGTADCVVRAKAKDYADLEMGRIDAKLAFLFGKVKVSRPAMMMTFINLFRGATEQA